jgi:hypothetical protein
MECNNDAKSKFFQEPVITTSFVIVFKKNSKNRINIQNFAEKYGFSTT